MKYKRETVEEFKDRMWADFKCALRIVVGLALYVFVYDKLGGL